MDVPSRKDVHLEVLEEAEEKVRNLCKLEYSLK